jgi:hypothetical protein
MSATVFAGWLRYKSGRFDLCSLQRFEGKCKHEQKEIRYYKAVNYLIFTNQFVKYMG